MNAENQQAAIMEIIVEYLIIVPLVFAKVCVYIPLASHLPLIKGHIFMEHNANTDLHKHINRHYLTKIISGCAEIQLEITDQPLCY